MFPALPMTSNHVIRPYCEGVQLIRIGRHCWALFELNRNDHDLTSRLELFQMFVIVFPTQ